MVILVEQSMLRWRLREIMARGRITNRELAQRLHRHETSISRMKNADTMPKMDGDELNSLCNVLTQLLRERNQDVVVTHADLMEHFPDDVEDVWWMLFVDSAWKMIAIYEHFPVLIFISSVFIFNA